MSVHQPHHAQSVGDLIDAIAAANTSQLSMAINMKWGVLLAAIKRTDAEGLEEAVKKIEALIIEHPDTSSEWWLVQGPVKQRLARLQAKGQPQSESHSVGVSGLTATEGSHRRRRIYGMHAK